MKAAPFEYVAPTTVPGCIAVLEDDEQAQLLAGGQSLLPMLALRLSTPTRLVDVTRVAELHHLEIEPGQPIAIGAAVRQARLEDHPQLAAANPLVAMTLPHIGHRPIRNRGTVGGSVAHADPAAEWPALLVTLDAVVRVASGEGARDIRAADLYEGPFMTALEPGQVLTGITLPAWPSTRGAACLEIGRRHGDFALVGAMVTAETMDATPRRLVITVFGGLSRPLRLRGLEERLARLERPHWAAAVREEIAGLRWQDDIHASHGLRVHVGSRLVHAAVTEAVDEANAKERAR